MAAVAVVAAGAAAAVPLTSRRGRFRLGALSSVHHTKRAVASAAGDCAAVAPRVAVDVSTAAGTTWRTLRAIDDVATSEVLIREQPLLIWEQGWTWDDHLHDATEAFAALHVAEQDRVLGFFCPSELPLGLKDADFGTATDRERTLMNILEVCSTGLADGMCGLYEHVACANHSCQPNAALRPDADGVMRFLAIRPVAAGDEVTISYLAEGDLLWPTSWRRRRLKRWAFDCNCPRCAAPDDTRGLRCPSCASGTCFPTKRGLWHHAACSRCAAPPAGKELQRAEAAWWRQWRPLIAEQAPALRGARARRFALGLGSREWWERRGARLRRLGWSQAAVSMHADLLATNSAAPSSGSHWLAAAAARDAAEAHLWRGEAEKAIAAAQLWRRFVRLALAGALAYDAAMSLEVEAAAAACAGDLQGAANLYMAALQEAAPLHNDWDSDDPLVPHLRRQLTKLDEQGVTP